MIPDVLTWSGDNIEQRIAIADTYIDQAVADCNKAKNDYGQLCIEPEPEPKEWD